MREDAWRPEDLPSQWASPRIGDLCDVVRGGSPRPMGDPRYFGGPIPFVKISDVTASDGRTLRETAASVTVEGSQRSRLIRAASLILSNSGTICVPVFLGVDACIHDGFVAFDKLSGGVSQEYLFHFFNFVRPHLRNKHKQGVTQVNLNTSIVGNICIPLPPLAEQKRIVAKIEELFSELEAGEESLRLARRQLATYRQSLLKQAFEGKLTAKWREQNPDKLEAWSWLTLEDVADVTGGLTKNSKRDSLPTSIPYLRVANVYANELRLNEIKDIGVTPAEANKVRLERGDLLIVEGNGSLDQIGRVALWDGSIKDCGHQNHLIRARCRATASPAFVLMFLLSPHGRALIEKQAASTSGLHTLSVSKVQRLPVPLCSLPEQQEIVRLLDEQFEVIERNEREIDAALQRSKALRQSILHRAFTGKLVPQNPADEPATELLARLREERAASTRLVRKKTRP